MHNPVFGQLDPLPAIEHPELLAPATFRAVQQYLPEALVAPIDPAVSDTEAMCARYDVPLGISANVVLITGKRSGEVRKVACQVLATHRVDVNHFVKQALDVRKCSFAPMDEAVEASAMAYGGITPGRAAGGLAGLGRWRGRRLRVDLPGRGGARGQAVHARRGPADVAHRGASRRSGAPGADRLRG